MLSAVYVVPLILQFYPIALELLDHSVFRDGQSMQEIESNNALSDHDGCLLFVEFADVQQTLK